MKNDLFSMFTIKEIQTYVSSFGVFAPLVYILILVISIVVSYIPNIPLAIASGALFGSFLGGVYSLIGGTLGALIAFYISKHMGRPIMKKLFGKTLYFCDRCDERYIGLVIFISRLLPFFSFDIISYGAGLTNIKTRTFLIATFFGMIPMTFLFSYLGKFAIIDQKLGIFLSLFIIFMFLASPYLIKRFNIFGLKDRIKIE